MNDEDAFLRTLLQNPADDTTRLVYADWLDERGDAESTAKAQFLRLTARLLDPNRPKRDDKELQKVAAGLNTDWLAVVSRLKVENCGERQLEREGETAVRPILFEFVCDKRWDEMLTTEDETVRFCEGCKLHVHYCATITEARDHARQGHCLAVDVGITRHQYDLNPPLMVLGMPSPEYMERERKRLGVDKVSLAREQAKERNQGGNG